MGLKSKIIFLLRQFPFVYPLRIITSCEEWIDRRNKKAGKYYGQRGPWHKVIFPADFVDNTQPKTVGQYHSKAFFTSRSYPTATASLFYLQNSYVFGHRGLILSRRHEVFQEFSHNFGISTLKKLFRKNPFYIFTNDAKHIAGVGAVLLSPESHNYYHWISDVLPRIRLYTEVIDRIDFFCIASNVPPKFIDILADFGIPADKLILIKENEKLYFQHLFVSSLPGSEGRSPRWAIDYVREKLTRPSDQSAVMKKIYFKRGVNAQRKILNEDAVIDALVHNGFDVIEPDTLTIHEQVNLMQHASAIVSAHGAALSNLLFCNANVIVVEIFSPDYFRTDCYYTLSSILKLSYRYLVGDKLEGSCWGDITVEPEAVISCLQTK